MDPCMYFFMGLGSDWQMCPFACEQGSIVMLWNDVECMNLICQPPLAICPITSRKNLAIWRDSLPGQKQSYSKMRWECCTCYSLIESSIPMDHHQFSHKFSPLKGNLLVINTYLGPPKYDDVIGRWSLDQDMEATRKNYDGQLVGSSWSMPARSW